MTGRPGRHDDRAVSRQVCVPVSISLVTSMTRYDGWAAPLPGQTVSSPSWEGDRRSGISLITDDVVLEPERSAVPGTSNVGFRGTTLVCERPPRRSRVPTVATTPGRQRKETTADPPPCNDATQQFTGSTSPLAGHRCDEHAAHDLGTDPGSALTDPLAIFRGRRATASGSHCRSIKALHR